MKTNVLAKINDVEIQVVENNSERLVPVKPICEALGIAYEPQFTKLKEDEFLSSVITLSITTGSDGKQYEMSCLPFEFVFGWLFTINPKNVKEEAREAVTKYRIECYRALFNYFTEPATFLKEKQKMIDKYLDEYETAKNSFRDAKKIMDEKKKSFDQVRNFSIEEWRENGRQYIIPFPEE